MRRTACPMSPARKEYHILNLGAGIQSTTLYLMAVRDSPLKLHFDAAIFADTQWEPKEVYRHLKWLQSLGGPQIIVRSAGSLGQHLIRGTNSTNQRFASIPAFTTDGEKIGRTKRQCSKEYKIQVIGQALRQDFLGLKPGQHVGSNTHVTSYVGISFDEAGRAMRMQKNAPEPKYITRKFPLIDWFMTRENCKTWLARYGNVPHEVPRSACVFCPFHSDAEWLKIKANKSDWARAVEIDTALRTTGSVANRNITQTMYLHKSCKPLVQIEFKVSVDPRAAQSNMHFAPECLGVCGV
jgi:hypothetical protein